jgi:hypothetical protein
VADADGVIVLPTGLTAADIAVQDVVAATAAYAAGPAATQPAMSPRTLYQRIVDAHTVRPLGDSGQILLYVDRQVLNEYTSPQAFAALHAQGRKVWRASCTLAVVDHVNATTPVRNARTMVLAMPTAPNRCSTLAENCARHGIELFDMLDSARALNMWWPANKAGCCPAW